MSEPNEDDGELPATTLHVRRAKRGDAASLAWVVERFTPLLLAQARYRLGGLARWHDPEELVQDVWAVALAALPALRAREGRETPVVLKFLATTLLYRSNEVARREARRSAASDPDDGAAELDALPAETRGIVTRAAVSEAGAAVRSAIDGLEGPDRDVLVLRGIEQHSNARVAELLGASPNAVSLRYNRALAALRKRLPGSVFDEFEDSDGNPGKD